MPLFSLSASRSADRSATAARSVPRYVLIENLDNPFDRKTVRVTMEVRPPRAVPRRERETRIHR